MKTHYALSMAILLLCNVPAFSQTSEKPNIIFIIVDDLNDFTTNLGGHPQSLTPGMSAIAENGTEFTNAMCPSPKCAPSRTSFMSGKDCKYSGIYNNPGCKPFRNYFHGKQVFTLPEYLKDSVGYYTIGINKIYHCFESDPDYDAVTADACAKHFSWNKYVQYYNSDAPEIISYGGMHNDGVTGIQWSKLPDSLEKYMHDYASIDSAILFIDQYEEGSLNTCGNPLFIAIGLRKPHVPWYVPQKYYSDYYVDDIYEEPFTIPYNHPAGHYPYNGVVLAPQPDPVFADFNALPAGGIGQYAALSDGTETLFNFYVSSLDDLPEISDTLSDPERVDILTNTERANATMAYLASIKFVDAQIGRLYDSLLLHPSFLNNSIIILIGDNGYSLGEKKHWQKGAMWETDMRVQLIISDMRDPEHKTCNQNVSLMDIFPTVCDLLNVPEPSLSSGAKYLDGQSLVPLIENPDLRYERPCLSSYQLHSDDGGEGCFPIYSVRNNEFHLLHYKENYTMSCNAAATLFTEQELYDIGTEREIDPHEWNNLTDSADYKIVKEYLQQWLPDSAKYLQSAFTISVSGMQCSYESDGDADLTAAIADYDGSLLSALPADKHIVWFTNLSDDSSFTADFHLSLSSIPSIVSGSKNEILIYTILYNVDYTVIEGLNIAHLKINDTPGLYPAFTVKSKKRKVSVTNIHYPPSTASAVWNYSDGYVYEGLTPPVHKFPASGTCIITCTATSAGSDSCITTKSKSFLVDNGNHVYMRLFPNPSVNFIYVETDQELDNYHIEIYNAAGIKVIEQDVNNSDPQKIDTGFLPEGYYILRLTSADYNEVQTFTKIDH